MNIGELLLDVATDGRTGPRFTEYYKLNPYRTNVENRVSS